MKTRTLHSLDERMLARTMSDISEDQWCAGWLSGLECSLWQAMHSEQRTSSDFLLSQQEQADLFELHRRVGGWIVWSDQERDTVFVEHSEWLAHLSTRTAE